ncbi:MAG: M42 family metallopeptidase [Bryobacteraceae bacterium]
MTRSTLGAFALFALTALAQTAEPDRVARLLEELTNAHGPSGFEGPVRAIARRELTPIANRIETDGLGSLIASIDGPAGSPRVMMAAHMDELGMIVKYITPEGFLKFQTLGGWLDQGLINQRFIVMTRKGPVAGVTGLKTPHVMGAEERVRLKRRDDIFLDVGAAGRADAEERLGIRPGDPIAPDSRFAILNGSQLYVAKAWDDRVGVAVLIEVLRRLKQNPAPCSVYAVATVQEEIGLRGAQTSSHQVKPDIGISVEVGVASDYPGITQDEAQERLGKGPGIFLHDSSMLPNLKLRDYFIDTAKAADLPLQFNVLSGYGEDGAEMQRAYSGIPAINVTVPTRYLHNHNGIIHRDDFDRAVDLVTAAIRGLNADTVRRLKSFD